MKKKIVSLPEDIQLSPRKVAEILESIRKQNRTRLRKGAALPAEGSEKLMLFSLYVEGLRQIGAAKRGRLLNAVVMRQKFRKALSDVEGQLPSLRAEYEKAKSALGTMDGVFRTNASEDGLATNLFDVQLAERQSHVLKVLEAAVADAREVGFLTRPEPPRKLWHDFAPTLERLFLDLLGINNRDFCHAFIREVIPYITGEQPTFEAVDSHLKKPGRAHGSSTDRDKLPAPPCRARRGISGALS